MTTEKAPPISGNADPSQKTSFSLRKATNRDVEAVITLISNALGEYGLPLLLEANDSDLYDLETNFANGGGTFELLLNGEREIIGSVALRRVDEETCELCRMYLNRSFRGMGLGKRLLDHALHQARFLDFRKVTLSTASELKEAIGLYQKAGFRPCPVDKKAKPCCDQAYVLDL